MKKAVLAVFFCAAIISNIYASPADKTFDVLKEKFVADLWKQYPDWATGLGYHKYDEVLLVPNQEDRIAKTDFARHYLDLLSKVDSSGLSQDNQTDYKLIKNRLQKIIWSIDVELEYEWNPALYNINSSMDETNPAFAYMINEPYEKLETRLLKVYKKLENVPAYYDAAKANLVHPPVVLKNLAIQQNEGSISVFEKDLIDSVNLSSLSDEQKKAITNRAQTAVAAIRSFIEWLKALPDIDALGIQVRKDIYEKKFEFDIQSRYSVDELYKAAMDRKDYLHKQMEEKANTLWSKYFGNTPKPDDKFVLIKKVIDTISTNHVKPEAFQSAIEQQLPKLASFIREKNLLYLDPTKPLKVRKEPGYMAGIAGASVSSPGPYEKNTNTYYNVGSLEGWSAEKAESYLREYNHYTLQILNIHEALPGHYVQLIYSNKAPSIIKSILGSSSMIEGWAVYSELMMMENGYDNSPEMWLMYYKWNLRSVCNTILDISVHTKDMSKEDAMELLTKQAFQQQTEAEGKWHRVNVTRIQLTSYFNGFYEILQLRDAYKKKMGNAYSVKKFNEQLLSYGSVPVKYIRQMMLQHN